MLLDPDLGYYDEGLDLTEAGLYLTARGRLGEATTLPPASYRSKIFSALEDNRVWSRNWIAVGAGQQIANPGDLLPFTIGYHGIHLQRGPDGSIVGRFNKAQHGGCRAVPLQCQTGSRTKCSFTSCGYSRDRGVIPAAELDGDRSSAQQYLGLRPERLIGVRVAAWGPVLFACLDPDTATLEQVVAGIAPPWAAEHRALAGVRWFEAEANWKLIGPTLADLVAPGADAAWRSGNGSFGLSGEMTAAIAGRAAGRVDLVWLFPNLLLLRGETSTALMLLQPLSMSETQVRLIVLAEDAAGSEALLPAWSRVATAAGRRAGETQSRLGNWGTSRKPETIGLAPPVQDSPLGLMFQEALIDCILEPRNGRESAQWRKA